MTMMDYAYNKTYSDGPIVSTVYGSNTSTGADNSLKDLNAHYALALLPFTIILGVFGVVGILGNILVFIVYGCGHKFKDKKYRVYVLNLAAIDFVTCLTLIPAEMWKHQSYFDFRETALCKMKCFLNVFAAASASLCLCIVAVDRYIMTCHPFLFVRVRAFSHTVAWRLCGIMIMIGVLLAVPSAIISGIAKTRMVSLDGNVTDVYICVADPVYESDISRFIYKISLAVAQTLISIMMIFLYVKIGIAIIKVMRLREFTSVSSLEMETTNNQSLVNSECSGPGPCRTNNLAIPSNVKLLFLITVVFIVTYFLYVCMSWIDQTKLSPVEFLLFSVFYRMYFIHSIINPFLYAKMDSHFRNRCRNILKF